jgi:phage-related protein
MTKLKFKTVFLEPAEEFLAEIEPKAKIKLIGQIEKAKLGLDPKVFKKLDYHIWEFRTEFMRMQYRLLAFWDKRDGEYTLVVATNGFIKKTDKVPDRELDRANKIRKAYYEKDDK